MPISARAITTLLERLHKGNYMNATQVRALFPGAEIDDEGFVTADKRIMIILSMPFGCHIHANSLSFEKFEALMYWYQNSAEFAATAIPS